MIFNLIPGFHFDQQLNVTTTVDKQESLQAHHSALMNQCVHGGGCEVEDMLCGLPHAIKVVK